MWWLWIQIELIQDSASTNCLLPQIREDWLYGRQKVSARCGLRTSVLCPFFHVFMSSISMSESVWVSGISFPVNIFWVTWISFDHLSPKTKGLKSRLTINFFKSVNTKPIPVFGFEPSAFSSTEIHGTDHFSLLTGTFELGELWNYRR